MHAVTLRHSPLRNPDLVSGTSILHTSADGRVSDVRHTLVAYADLVSATKSGGSAIHELHTLNHGTLLLYGTKKTMNPPNWSLNGALIGPD